ncbi:MAG TPA: S53 family peptidase [Gammaproteobacteria bacterium]|nr:S53 family peptidase [Gammaproteobacteria bacterium]
MHKQTTLKLASLTSIVMGFLSVNANAVPLPHLNGIAHAPHIIKPNTPNGLPTGLSPNQVSIAYGFTSLGRWGAGQTIALVDAYDAPTIENDLSVFNSTFGLKPCTTFNGCFRKIYADGFKPQLNGDWAVETTLDVEWAHAMAPRAKILLVEATDDRMDSLMRAVQVATFNGANFVSMSWGSPEDPNETAIDVGFNNPNVTYVAASGDGGHGIIYPAASPYVLSVGGTTLYIDPITSAYISETAWSGSGGGLSLYENEPAYQVSYQIPNNPFRKRGVPDVSYNADPNTGFSVYDSTPDSFGNYGWLIIGGTSASAPQWAALLADANSASIPPRLTNFSNLLYIAALKHYGRDYHDIMIGNNGMCGYYCNAQIGYDYVTGLGSSQVANLVNDMRTGALK